MALLDNLEKTFGKVANVTVQKSKEVTQLAKLNTKLAGINRELDEMFASLGRAVYQARKDQPDSPYAQLFARIADKQAQAQALQGQLNEIRDVKVCTQCGTANPKESQFCSKCGASLGDK